MTYPSQSSNQSNYVLIVAAPGSEVASRLAEDLRQAGISVAQADTPEVASRAALAPTCIAVLTPTTWNHPVVIAAVTARPARLIPVLAEPMPLPQGPWTSPPLAYDQNTARTIAAGFSNQSSVPPQPFYSSAPDQQPNQPQPQSVPPPLQPMGTAPQFQPYTPNNTTEYMPQGGVGNQPPMLTPIPQRRKRPVLTSLLGVLFIVVVVAAIVIVPKVGKKLGIIAATATPDPSYSAIAPGPVCDKGKGVWDKNTTTTVTFTCQSDALVVTQQALPTKYAEVFYRGNGTGAFPLSYSVGVTATLTDGSKYTSLGFAVHGQTGKGGQIFEASPATQWDVLHYGTMGGTPTQLGVGFTDNAAQTLQLQVDVNGAVMTFTINGKVVTTITDASFSTTDSVALVMFNGSDTKTATAHFNNFTYKPLPNPTLAATDAQATATAVATASALTPYTADAPGHGCDKGNGQWADPTIFGNGSTTTTCQPTALVMQSTDFGILRYYGKDGNFPSNYSVQVTADASKLNAKGCILLEVRDSSAGSYASQVCGDGVWEIDGIASDGTSTVLKSGFTAKVASYTLLMTANNANISLSINGKQVTTVSDSSYTATDIVGLGVYTPGGTTSTVSFSKFVFTPLA